MVKVVDIAITLSEASVQLTTCGETQPGYAP